MSCPGDLYVVPGAAPCAGGGGGGAGVTTLNSLTGGINLTSVSGSLIIAPLGNNIDFTAGGVTTLNTTSGNVNLISSDASVTITPSGTDVDLTVLPGGVTSIVAGTGVIIDPPSGVGAVTINANLSAGSVVSNTQAVGIPITITATTLGSAQSLSSITIRTTGVSNIVIVGNLVVSNQNTPTYDIYYFVEAYQAGVTTTIGLICRANLSAFTGYLTCPIAVSANDFPAGNITCTLKAYASVASAITVQASQIIPMGNLIKTGGTLTTINLPVVAATGTVDLYGGGVAINIGSVTGLPLVDPANNPTVSWTLTMSGVGTANISFPNDIYVGIYQNNTTFIGGYSDIAGSPVPSFNWGTLIPSGLNYSTTFNVPIATYQTGNFNYAAFLSYTYSPPTIIYDITNLQFQLSMTYIA
jgi:hypothetical protein